LPIFLLMALGKIIKIYWLTSDEFWRGVEKLSYFLLFPCALFNYIASADLGSSEILSVVAILIGASCILACGLIIYKKRFDISGQIFTSIFQGSIRYNNYMFFGIGSALYNQSSLSLISIVALYLIVFTNAASILAFSLFLKLEQNGHYLDKIISLVKKFTLNPMIFASIAALIFNKMEMKFSVSISKLLDNLSNSALTMGIITLGSGLTFSIGKTEQFKPIIITSICKLLILPLLTYAMLCAFHIEGIPREIGLLYSALPCATTAYILSKQLGGDHELMASIITFTTVFSILSLSFLMYILV